MKNYKFKPPIKKNPQQVREIDKKKQKKGLSNTIIVSTSLGIGVGHGLFTYYHPSGKEYAYKKFGEILRDRSNGARIRDLFKYPGRFSKKRANAFQKVSSSLYKKLTDFTNSSGRLQMSPLLSGIIGDSERVVRDRLRTRSSGAETITRLWKALGDKSGQQVGTKRAEYVIKESQNVAKKIEKNLKKCVGWNVTKTSLSVFSVLLIMKHTANIINNIKDNRHGNL